MHNFESRCLICGLALLLAMPPKAMAQTPAPPPLLPSASTQTLKVIALAGSQEMNALESKVMAPLVVEVVDLNDRPVEGATVVFRFPLDGPTATFADQKNSASYRTNADGQARATGWMANSKVGTFQVLVSASRDNEVGSATISMTNVTRIVGDAKTHKSWWSSKWAKIGVIAGAAGIATAIILLTRGSGSSSSNSGTVITATPGSPSIGAPQ